MTQAFKTYSGLITSCFAGHVSVEVKIGDGKTRQFILSEACNVNFMGSNDSKASVRALREGLTATIRMVGDPETALLDAISPNYR